jgi:CheY-like chemotaxis protein
MSRVLIVDDDLEQLTLFAEAFKNRGFSVDKAQSGEEGIRLARNIAPDLMLLDIIMPGLGGLETLKKIKADKDLKELKILLMTNLTRPGLAEAAAQGGAADFILKADLTPSELVERAKHLIG